jgi:glycine/D-amino acid oxidase-like deaminating enzyme
MEQEYRKLSYWHDSAPGTLEPRTALDSETEADIAIVGAGYTGLWTAYYLKQIDPSLNIVILEAEISGFGASGRNGGWCAGYLAGIDHWLDDPVYRDQGMRLQRLMFDTVQEVGRVARRESIDCHFEQSGALEIAVNPAQLARLSAELDHMRSLGFGEDDYQWLGQGELQDTLGVDQALAAIHMKHCAAVHPFRLARGLATVLENLGVTIYEKSPVLEIKNRELITPSGKVEAGAVVVATEGYSGTVAGCKRRLIPVHSMMVVTEPLSDQQLEAINFQHRYCFGSINRLVTYGQLTADRRIAFGCRGSYHYGSGIKTFDCSDPEFDLVAASLLQFFPGLKGISFTHGWGGAMGVSRSLRPSVNFDPEHGCGWAGGYFGNGVGATHLAGQTMADLVTGNETERTQTPWVNPVAAQRKWEPEPIRWLGVQSRAKLMQLADRAEHRGSRFAPVISKTLDTVFP